MSNTPHELMDDFPGEAAKIHDLKQSNAHFARLVAEYHAINRDVHRAETRAEAMDPEHEAELRRRRVRLKDEIAQMLRAV
jgi:uncharacterized protein YdcH (DUF465 family)